MARKITAADLTLVPCCCTPDQSIGGGVTETEWHDTPREAAVAVKRHVDRIGAGGHPYWAVHYGNAHVVSAVIGGWRYGGADACREPIPA